MKDIIITPRGEEAAFIEQAEKLGTKQLLPLHKQPTPTNWTNNSTNPHTQLQHGLLIQETNKGKLKRLIETAKTKKLITAMTASGDETLNRFIIEQTPIDLIFGFETLNPKDSLHYRRGGLDQTLCTLLAKRKITVGFSFEEILTSKKPAVIIGRMIQNIKLCKKYNVPMMFASFASKPEHLRSLHDLGSLVASWDIDGTTIKRMF